MRVTALGGLLEVALHPKFEDNGFVYLTYAKGRGRESLHDGDGAWPFEGKRAGRSSRDLCRQHAESSATNFGGRIAFDRSGNTFILRSVNVRNRIARRKETTTAGRCCGCAMTACVLPTIPSLVRPAIVRRSTRSVTGVRKGLGRSSGNGRDLGKRTWPLGGDEINIILPGRNYGWPLVTFGMNYDGTKSATRHSAPTWSAIHVLGAFHCDFGYGVLFGRQISQLERQRLRRIHVRRPHSRNRAPYVA